VARTADKTLRNRVPAVLYVLFLHYFSQSVQVIIQHVHCCIVPGTPMKNNKTNTYVLVKY